MKREEKKMMIHALKSRQKNWTMKLLMLVSRVSARRWVGREPLGLEERNN